MQSHKKQNKYSTAELAKLGGVTKNTILRWEESKLIPKAKRDMHGWRYWSKDDLSKVLDLKKQKTLINDSHNKEKLRINIIGYGNQAEAWAKNLKNSGADVLILLKLGSPSIKRAVNDGFDVALVDKTLKNNSDGVFCVLIPDENHKQFFLDNKEFIKPTQTFIFAHGFSVGYQEIKVNAKTILLAPKAIAKILRLNYLESKTVPAAYAISNEEDFDFVKKLSLMLGLSPLIKSSFYEETVSDLFSEQLLLCGGVPALIIETFNKLKQKGINQELAFYECLYELSYIIDVIKNIGVTDFFSKISPVAMHGGINVWKKIEAGENISDISNEVYKNIDDKTFLNILENSNKEEEIKFVEQKSKSFDSVLKKLGGE